MFLFITINYIKIGPVFYKKVKNDQNEARVEDLLSENILAQTFVDVYFRWIYAFNTIGF